MAGVPYDGTNPRNFDLYHDEKKIYWNLPWNENGIPIVEAAMVSAHQRLVDKYEPICFTAMVTFHLKSGD